jgi:poly(A) polymerase
MKVSGEWLAADATQKVCAALTDAGHQALFVGGCVRNALIGAPVADIDISTDALPQTVMQLCTEAGMHVVPTGIEHGTVTVVTGGIPHEVTTFRRDVETDGRRAVVAFSTRIEDDAMRRDLTMNALYARPDGTVVDPLGGLPDLMARRVRFVGKAADRIREDYLRILRFFRFHAWYADPEGGIDADGLSACAELAEGIARVSRERIGAEMHKLLAAPDPAPAVAAMAGSGVLHRVLPGATAEFLAPLIHLEHSIAPGLTRCPDALRVTAPLHATPRGPGSGAGAVGDEMLHLPPRWQRRLAALGAEGAAERLRLSKAEAETLDQIAAALQSDLTISALAYLYGPDIATDATLIRAASLGTEPPPGWDADIAFGAAQVFPVNAADLMPALQGRELGQRLADLERRWIGSGFTLTRADLLA